MSLHYYPQSYRYRSATRTSVIGVSAEQGSDSDVAELSDLEDDGDEDDADEEEEADGEDEEADELPYPGFVPLALRYLDQTTRPRNWCLALITNPYPFSS